MRVTITMSPPALGIVCIETALPESLAQRASWFFSSAAGLLAPEALLERLLVKL